MAKPTLQELKALEAFERRHKNSYRFLREAPREQRDIPFAESSEDVRNKKPSIMELVLWFLIWGGFLGFLFFVLHLEQELPK